LECRLVELFRIVHQQIDFLAGQRQLHHLRQDRLHFRLGHTSAWATWPSTLEASLAPRADTTTLCTDCLLVLATSAWRSRVLPLPSGP
jgi:hypothetical protein